MTDEEQEEVNLRIEQLEIEIEQHKSWHWQNQLEYALTLANLTNTQARCGVLLLALRDVQKALRDAEPEAGLGPDTVAGLLLRVKRALNPPTS